jgi:methionine synthase II (cobalamin-independent)
VVGPFTLALSVRDEMGNLAVNDQEIFEAILAGIKKKVLWQVDFLRRTNRRVVIFLDEPSLSGYGSAFTPVTREQIMEGLSGLIGEIKGQRKVMIGIHCCGNTDWGLLLQTGIDIISFDAWGFLENFLLYPREIKEFLERGGMISWGLIPTHQSVMEVTRDSLLEKLGIGLRFLKDIGFERDFILKRSIITPSCGMGSLNEIAADRVMGLLKTLDIDFEEGYDGA